MANIKQVAELAGLSVSCVSKYLKNPESVLPASREKIETAIAALHYVPSNAARSLRTKRTYTVKAVMESITNPFYAEIFECLRNELDKFGYTLVLQINDDKAYQEKDFQTFDGVISCFLNKEESLQNIIQLAGKKLIMMHWHTADRAVPSITLDFGHAISLAAQHLIDCGCRQLAYIGGPRENVVSVSKRAGMLACVQQNGLTIAEDTILEGKFSFEFGYFAAKQLLERSTIPDGIICENDILAAGAIRRLTEQGIAIPEQVQLTGFDDIPMANMLVPSLTTVSLPLQRMCHAAAQLFLDRIENKPLRHEVFQASLITRKSTNMA